MKMSAEEIVKAYNADRSRENMQRIADENGCTLHEIGEFLKDSANMPQNKRPGRPKKQKADKTLDNKNKITCSKVEPIEENKRPHTYLISPLLETIAKEKIAELRRKCDFFKTKAMEAEIEADELQDFLNGGYSDGQKDGI